jgi:hypothetical protein
MSKITIIAIAIGIIAVGSAAAIMMGSEQPKVSPTIDETTVEPPTPKGKDIQLNFEDGIAMSVTP